MTRPVLRSLPLLLVGLLLAGCTGSSGGGNTPPRTTVPTSATPKTASPASAAGLAGVDWTKVIDDIDCLAAGNRGIEVLGTKQADVRGKGVRDTFVWFDCVHGASTWPGQLEVFDGSSPAGDPRRIAVLISAEESSGGPPLLISDLSFSGDTVTVDLRTYGPQDARCCPTGSERRSYAWTGSRFVQRPAA
ncbi:LppP/LprE family lipoprotein [Streptomyces sp. NPDC002587]